MSYVPTSQLSFTPQEPSSASRSITSTGQTTVVDVTESGIVHFAVVEMTTGISGTGGTAKLKFTIDGGTASNITVTDSATAKFSDWLMAGPGNGDGSTNNDRRTVILGFTYKTSLKVEIDCTAPAFAAGTMKVTVVRSKKV